MRAEYHIDHPVYFLIGGKLFSRMQTQKVAKAMITHTHTHTHTHTTPPLTSFHPHPPSSSFPKQPTHLRIVEMAGGVGGGGWEKISLVFSVRERGALPVAAPPPPLPFPSLFSPSCLATSRSLAGFSLSLSLSLSSPLLVFFSWTRHPAVLLHYCKKKKKKGFVHLLQFDYYFPLFIFFASFFYYLRWFLPPSLPPSLSLLLPPSVFLCLFKEYPPFPQKLQAKLSPNPNSPTNPQAGAP